MSLGATDGEKAYEILLRNSHDMRTAQRLIDKKRLFCGDALVESKNEILRGEVFLIDYECHPRGILPIWENASFAVFDKPAGVLSHPNGRHCKYSLYDEIWHLYGKSACVAHRLDLETSGLIIVAKNAETTTKFKQLFESRAVEKKYLALVQGKCETEFACHEKIGANPENFIKIRQSVIENGKESLTEFRRLKYYENLDMSLVEACPKTGRQHQIRLHLFHMKHRILGDTIYGVKDEIVEQILAKTIDENTRKIETGAKRLCLHASEISFKFDGKNYRFESKIDIEKEFLAAL